MCAARVRPSGLGLTVPCPGSLQTQERVPPVPETREQAEGSVAHIVALKYAQGLGHLFPVGHKLDYNGTPWEITEDMVDGALMYKEEAQVGGRFEEGVNIPDIPECAGTPDYWRYIVETFLKLLKVIDYKFGHRYVEVWEHWQTLAYASGIARFLNLPLDFAVTLVIVQPRCYTGAPIREWKTTVGEIYGLIAERVTPRVQLALTADPPTYAGRHCLDCRARHACKTLQHSTANIVEFAATSEVQYLPPEAVGPELRILKEAMKHLEARYTGLYEQASNLARSGQRIPFWSMERTKGKFDWVNETPHAQIIGMAELMQVNVRKPEKLLTPTQAIDAGIDRSIIEQYAKHYPGATRLVEDNTTTLRKVFKQ
jgi:Protein of unknown function (DUF2800)